MTGGAIAARRAALWVLLAIVWFGTLGLRPLYKADESRYAEISREMLASGDWVTPRLNAFKYFEKPPLQYWTTAAAFAVLGEHDWVARLWTALIGFAGIALTLLAANRLFGPPVGYYAAAILAGSPLYAVLAQVNTLDMSVTFFLSAAIFAAALERWLWFWVACALAVLSKGLIGIVLPVGALGLYTLLKRDWSIVRRARIAPGLALFFAICAPWFVLVSMRNPQFAHFFFIQEHFERFTTEMHHRVEPAWYFIVVLAAGMLPWLVPLASSAVQATRQRSAAELLLWCWAVVVFVFFSISSSKLPPYILPIFPALAVLAARALTARVLSAQAIVLGAVGLGAAAAVHSYAANGPYAAYARWLAVAALFLALGAAYAWLLLRRARLDAAVITLAAATLAATLLGLVSHRTLAARFSVEPTLAAVAERPGADTPVYAVDMYDHTIPWNLRRTVTMVAYRDELGVAIDWERDKFIPDLKSFAAAWNAQAQAWAFMPADAPDRLQRELGIRMELVARGPTYAIVKKP